MTSFEAPPPLMASYLDSKVHYSDDYTVKYLEVGLSFSIVVTKGDTNVYLLYLSKDKHTSEEAIALWREMSVQVTIFNNSRDLKSIGFTEDMVIEVLASVLKDMVEKRFPAELLDTH